MERAGFRGQSDLARSLGVAQPTVFKLLSGVFEGTDLLQKIAEKTSVSFEWLRFGDADKAPPWVKPPPAFQLPEGQQLPPGRGTQAPPAASISAPLHVVAAAKAGTGLVTWKGEHSFGWPASWKLVQVDGDSAFPVIFPDQYAAIDTDRAATPAQLEVDRETCLDLDDNLVVLEVEQPDGSIATYLKRFCYDDQAGKYVVTSANLGLHTPYVDPARILVIVPVVAVIFDPPHTPRQRRTRPPPPRRTGQRKPAR